MNTRTRAQLGFRELKALDVQAVMLRQSWELLQPQPWVAAFDCSTLPAGVAVERSSSSWSLRHYLQRSSTSSQSVGSLPRQCSLRRGSIGLVKRRLQPARLDL